MTVNIRITHLTIDKKKDPYPQVHKEIAVCNSVFSPLFEYILAPFYFLSDTL